MIGVTWAAARHGARVASGNHRSEPALDLRGIARVIPRYRILGWALVVLLFAGVALVISSGYVAKRVRVWADPWAHRWDGGCVPATSPPMTFPDAVLCQESMLANQEAARSQVGRIWQRLPTAGCGVAASAIGCPPRCRARRRTSSSRQCGTSWAGWSCSFSQRSQCCSARCCRVALPGLQDVRPRLGSLLAIGLAAMIVTQFFFVLAATLNLIPHSGIPVPFLSRGGHSTLALLIALAVALAMMPRTVATKQRVPDAAALGATRPPNLPAPVSSPASPPAWPSSCWRRWCPTQPRWHRCQPRTRATVHRANCAKPPGKGCCRPHPIRVPARPTGSSTGAPWWRSASTGGPRCGRIARSAAGPGRHLGPRACHA